MILAALKTVACAFGPFESREETGALSSTLRDIVFTLPGIRPVITALLDSIFITKAKANDKLDLWTDPHKYPNMVDAKDVRLRLITTVETLTVAR